MLLTEDEANDRIAASNNAANYVINRVSRAHHKQSLENRLTLEEQAELASRVQANAGNASGRSNEDIAAEYGVSRMQANHLARGFTGGTVATPNTQLVEATERKTLEINQSAGYKLLAALGVITDEKLESLKAKDASIVAANLSRVMANTAKKDKATNQILIINTPEERKIDAYKVIDVS